MLKFEKRLIKDHIINSDGIVEQQGTPLTAEQLNRYENAISELVEIINRHEETICFLMDQVADLVDSK